MTASRPHAMGGCERAGELSIDPDRLAVGGDGAGGTLATAVAMEAVRREAVRNSPIRC